MAEKVSTTAIVPRRAQLLRISSDPDVIRFFELLGENLTRDVQNAVNANADELDGAASSVEELSARCTVLEIRLANAERRAQGIDDVLMRLEELRALVIGV